MTRLVRAAGAVVAGYHALKLSILFSNAARFPRLAAHPRPEEGPPVQSFRLKKGPFLAPQAEEGAPLPALAVRGDPSSGEASPSPSATTRPPTVSLLVPARDEEERLPESIPGLLAQPADEIVVLDDQSSDGTAAVVQAAARRDPRVRLVSGRPTPLGWVGKNWACQQLAQVAASDLLVFCDADVRLRPGALAAVCAEWRRQGSDVFSVFPQQLTGTVGERLLVPLIDETVLGFLPYDLLRAPLPALLPAAVPVPAAANGQFLGFTRAAYGAVGGHRAVAGRIVEDLALARRARRGGLRVGLALGGDVVTARMYPGYRASVRGFGKSLREAHGGSSWALLASAGWHLLAFTVPWLRASRGGPGSGRWRFAGAAGPVARLVTNAVTGRATGRDAARACAEALLPPVLPLAAAPVYALALRRRARWRGRWYR